MRYIRFALLQVVASLSLVHGFSINSHYYPWERTATNSRIATRRAVAAKESSTTTATTNTHKKQEANKDNNNVAKKKTKTTKKKTLDLDDDDDDDSYATAKSLWSFKKPPRQKSLDETYQINLEISRLAHEAYYQHDKAKLAHQLLRNLTNPDTVSYNGVLKAYARTYQPAHAQALLETMERIHSKQLQQQEQQQEMEDDNDDNKQQQSHSVVMVEPNVVSYSTVMGAWGRSGNPQKAHDLLRRLEARYIETGDPNLQPNTISYNSVLTAYAKSNWGERAALAASNLLQEMLDKQQDQEQEEQEQETNHNEKKKEPVGVIANVVSYNAVIDAWARSGCEDAAERAQQVLQQEMGNNTVHPNCRSYTTVMNAWSRSSRPDKVQRVMALLEEMQRLCLDDPKLCPNTYTYSTVLNCLSQQTREPHKAQQAYDLLQEMKRLYETGQNPHAQPTIVAYNSVLNACATSSPSQAQQVEQLIHQICQDVSLFDVNQRNHQRNDQLQPDHFTFGTILKACANVLWDNPTFTQRVFEQACREGQVSHGVCLQFRHAAPSQLYRDTIPRGAINPANGHFVMNYLPPAWTRNVCEAAGPKPTRKQQKQQRGGIKNRPSSSSQPQATSPV